ncbi:Nucleotidyltransferase, partial [Russula emetica]
QEMRESERFNILSLCTNIYGIGPAKARTLYNRGLRSLQDLEAYFKVETGSVPEEHSESADLTIRIALGLRDDLQLTCGPLIEAIQATIMDHLNTVEPGYVSTICGGYVFRRGKQEDNDIDIVFTHANKNKKSTKDLCERLVEHLRSAGLVTHVLQLAGYHEHDTPRPAERDSIEKAIAVYQSPNGPHRRVDLICALPKTYWTAVVGWTGATMFQRNLWLAAKSPSGLYVELHSVPKSILIFKSPSTRRNSELMFPQFQKEIFDIVDLTLISLFVM